MPDDDLMGSTAASAIGSAALALMAVWLIAQAAGRRRGRARILLFGIAAAASVLLLSTALRAIRWLAAHNAVLAAQFAYGNIPLLCAMALAFFMLPLAYISTPRAFALHMCAALAITAFGMLYAHLTTAVPAVFGIGVLCGMVSRHRRIAGAANTARAGRAKETRRDAVQILMGAALLILFASLPAHTAITVSIAAIFASYAVAGYARSRRSGAIFTTLASLERGNDLHLTGATYLAAGASLAMGFAPDTRVLMFSIVALFLADAASTMAGMRIRSARLTHNRAKSIAGTLAYFVVCAAAGYAFLGYYAIALGAVAAAVESMPLSLDDNTSCAIAILICAYALSL